MKKLILLLLLVCTCATLSWAQSGKRITVTGSVIDGDDKSPVGQATVQLLSLPDSTMVVGNVTNNNGVFSIAARPGKYVLKISFVGYLTQEKSLQLTAGKPSVNIGTVTLPTDAIRVYKLQRMRAVDNQRLIRLTGSPGLPAAPASWETEGNTYGCRIYDPILFHLVSSASRRSLADECPYA